MIGAIAWLLCETFKRLKIISWWILHWIENEQPELNSPVCIDMGYNNSAEDVINYSFSWILIDIITRAAQCADSGDKSAAGRFWQGEKMVSKSGRTDFLASKTDQQVKQHISNHTEHEL